MAADPLASDRRHYFFGVATIDRAGTICLRIVSHEGPAPRIHVRLSYDRSHPRYVEIVRHVGPIEPGEEKVIRSFDVWPNTCADSPPT